MQSNKWKATLSIRRRPKNPSVVNGDVFKNPVQVHVLLSVRIDQIVKVMSRNGENRLAVELGIVEPVQQMNAARSRCRNTGAEAAGVLGVGASHECGGFFVAHLNETDLFLPLAQRFMIPFMPSPGKPKTTSTPQS
jgi:hypothetical protein